MLDVASTDWRFPFGRPSTPRPPRRPAGTTKVAVVGVYPSALHIRWRPPAWAPDRRPTILAVDDEPTVFWDGGDALERVAAWKDAVGFRDGDAPGAWGHATAAGNGTSGIPVRDLILRRLGSDADSTWFTDVVDQYFIKDGTGSQAQAIRDRYTPSAAQVSTLRPALLPARPTPSALVTLSITQHAARLRSELVEASPEIVVTLGEEARQVLAQIADGCDGPPTHALTRPESLEDSYGRPGTVTIGRTTANWYAAVHPGNRSPAWRALHSRRFAT